MACGLRPPTRRQARCVNIDTAMSRDDATGPLLTYKASYAAGDASSTRIPASAVLHCSALGTVRTCPDVISGAHYFCARASALCTAGNVSTLQALERGLR